MLKRLCLCVTTRALDAASLRPNLWAVPEPSANACRMDVAQVVLGLGFPVLQSAYKKESLKTASAYSITYTWLKLSSERGVK